MGLKTHVSTKTGINVQKNRDLKSAFSFCGSTLTLALKSIETSLTALLAAEKNPEMLLILLGALTPAKAICDLFAKPEDDYLIERKNIINLIPAGINAYALLGADEAVHPAIWILVGIGCDITLMLIQAYRNREKMKNLDKLELGIETVKKSLIMGLISSGHKIGSVLDDIKIDKPIEKSQIGIAISTSCVAALSVCTSMGMMACRFFKSKPKTPPANSGQEIVATTSQNNV